LRPLNVAEAIKWYRLAADQGEVQAQYNLGVMYAQGRGVQKNYTLAHMWFNLAAKQGDQDAVKNQNLIAQLMTPAQISEAQKLAREWKSKSAGGGLSDADVGLLPDVSAPKQSAQGGTPQHGRDLPPWDQTSPWRQCLARCYTRRSATLGWVAPVV
jgi:hypothetical protein